MKRIVAYVMIALLSISSISYTKVEASDVILSDVKIGDWYKSNVDTLIGKGIVKGFADGTFKPNNTVTKAQFVKMVITSMGYNELQNGGVYWATPYINKAILLRLLSPREVTSEEFEKPITRADMAVIIAKGLQERYADNLEDYANLLSDYESIKDIYKEYVLKVYSKGIIGGYTDGKFKADNGLTRAEASTVILRMIEPNVRLKVEDAISKEDVTRLQSYELTSGQIAKDLSTLQISVYKGKAERYFENFIYGIDYTKLQKDDVPWRFAYIEAKGGDNKEDEDKMIKSFIDNQIINEAEFITNDNLIYKSNTGNIMIRGILKYSYTSTLEAKIEKNVQIKKDVEVEINGQAIVKNVKYLN
ncbi:MAG TPA: hypothetical protein DEP72_07840 [Clostridiales bacterium]|nr:hypothetical protein [Clostridiales bacterium]